MANVTIKALSDGPYDFPAALSFWTNSAKEYAESALDPLYLCRCGASKNKPLCDSSHEEIGFKAEETAK